MATVCARSKATHYLFTALFYNVVGEGPSIVNVFFVCVFGNNGSPTKVCSF